VNLEKYKALFVDEATDHLAEMSGAISVLESREGGDAASSIDTLFRMAHSIKGMAASLEYESLASLAHRLEDWLEPLREAGMLPDPALSLLYEAVGALESMVGVVAATGVAPAADEGLLGRLAQPLDLGAEAAPRPPEQKKKLRRSRDRLCRAPSACVPMRSTASWRPWAS
jgi:two-component system chemotaxis sensor kinase CheA